jgi:hypothetical protein
MTKYAIIVDPLSTGQEYPTAFREAGAEPVAVLSGRELPEAFAAQWHPENFNHVHVFDGDLHSLAEDLHRYEPKYLIPGAESGVELCDALIELVVPGTGNVPELAPARRDKWQMAQALARAGVPHLRQICTSDPAEVQQWLEDNDLLPYGGTKATGQLTVGSTNFAEQEIVAELYAQVLESAGVQVSRKFQLGNREIVAPALEKGDIDLYPEYLGTYLLFVDESTTVPSDKAAAAAELNELLESKGITVLAPSDAQDTNAFVVTKETAEKYDLKAVSDLARVPDSLTLGGPPECPTRPFCLVGLREIYGLKFE